MERMEAGDVKDDQEQSDTVRDQASMLVERFVSFNKSNTQNPPGHTRAEKRDNSHGYNYPRLPVELRNSKPQFRELQENNVRHSVRAETSATPVQGHYVESLRDDAIDNTKRTALKHSSVERKSVKRAVLPTSYLNVPLSLPAKTSAADVVSASVHQPMPQVRSQDIPASQQNPIKTYSVASRSVNAQVNIRQDQVIANNFDGSKHGGDHAVIHPTHVFGSKDSTKHEIPGSRRSYDTASTIRSSVTVPTRDSNDRRNDHLIQGLQSDRLIPEVQRSLSTSLPGRGYGKKTYPHDQLISAATGARARDSHADSVKNMKPHKDFDSYALSMTSGTSSRPLRSDAVMKTSQIKGHEYNQISMRPGTVVLNADKNTHMPTSNRNQLSLILGRVLNVISSRRNANTNLCTNNFHQNMVTNDPVAPPISTVLERPLADDSPVATLPLETKGQILSSLSAPEHRENDAAFDMEVNASTMRKTLNSNELLAPSIDTEGTSKEELLMPHVRM